MTISMRLLLTTIILTMLAQPAWASLIIYSCEATPITLIQYEDSTTLDTKDEFLLLNDGRGIHLQIAQNFK